MPFAHPLLRALAALPCSECGAPGPHARIVTEAEGCSALCARCAPPEGGSGAGTEGDGLVSWETTVSTALVLS
jgi:hypothetical protein